MMHFVFIVVHLITIKNTRIYIYSLEDRLFDIYCNSDYIQKSSQDLLKKIKFLEIHI